MEEEVTECGICQGSQIWDNQETKRGNQPDFKCKTCGAAAWINEDGSVGWKQSQQRPQPQQRRFNGGGRQRSGGGSSNAKDDYYNRKEARELEGQRRQGRAHAQDMALLWLKAKVEILRDTAAAITSPPTPKELKLLFDFFEHDVNRSGMAGPATPAPKPAPQPEQQSTTEDEGITL